MNPNTPGFRLRLTLLLLLGLAALALWPRVAQRLLGAPVRWIEIQEPSGGPLESATRRLVAPIGPLRLLKTRRFSEKEPPLAQR